MPRIKRFVNRYLQAFLDQKCAVIHIRLPKYVRLWYIATYGSPVVLDVFHPARAVLEHSICRSNSMSIREVMTMSMAKWAIYEQSEQYDPKSWLTVVLPDVVYRKDERIDVTGENWDVYDADSSMVREMLCERFWAALMKYLHKRITECLRKGTEYRLDLTLQMFCAEYGISIDHYESIRQGYFRQLKRCDKEMDEIRDAVRTANDERLQKEGESVKTKMLSFLDKEIGV